MADHNGNFANTRRGRRHGRAAEHRNDPGVRLVEVDVDTAAYDQGHIPGAWAGTGKRRPPGPHRPLTWPPPRPWRACSPERITPQTTIRPLRRQQQLVRGLCLLDAQVLRPRQRSS